jgi:hypothetical protein
LKQTDLEGAEEAELEPEQRIMTVLNLTEGLRLLEAGINLLKPSGFFTYHQV